MLGQALEKHHDVTLITKAGYVQEASDERDFSEQGIVSSLQSSLLRLKKCSVGVFLFHSPPKELLTNGALESIGKSLLDLGLCEKIGVSLSSVEDYQATQDWKECRVVELILNLLDQRALDRGYLNHAEKSGRSVIARLPLSMGFLGNKHKNTQNLEAEDVRLRWQDEQLVRWQSVANDFRTACQGDMTLVNFALLFCLSCPAVRVVIPGFKNVAHLEEIGPLLNGELSLPSHLYDRARDIWSANLDLPPSG